MNKKLIAPLASILLLSGISVGTTFALFTSNASSQVNVNAGIVKVNYSSTLDEAKSRYLDVNPFNAVEAASGTEYDAVFENGGTAKTTVTEDGSTVLTLNRIAPMDMIELTAKASNASNINIKYRYVVTLDGELVPALNIFIDGTDYSTDLTHKEIKSVWSTVVSPNVEGLFQKDVEIYFPYGGEEQNAYQDKSCTITISCQAIQGNAYVVNEQTNPEIPQVETIYSSKPSGEDKFTDMQNSNGTIRAEVKGSSIDSEAEKLTFNIDKMIDCHNLTPVSVAQDYFALDLDIEEIKEDNVDPIKMSVDIGPDKENVRVYHEGDSIPSTYNEVTGIVEWETLSCSQFDILWDIVLVTNYSELEQAITDKANYIRFGNDITDIPNYSSLYVDCSTVIDGYSFKLTHQGGESSGNHAVVEIGDDNVDVTIKNLTILNPKYRGICNRYSGVNLVVDNCEINSWFNIVFVNDAPATGSSHAENCSLLVNDSVLSLDQIYAGDSNGAVCIQTCGYNHDIVIKNSTINTNATKPAAEGAIIGGSNYKWSSGTKGSNMGNCNFVLDNCDINLFGDNTWFYYFDCDEENDTNTVIAKNCTFDDMGGESLFTNPYAFNYPVDFDHCFFSMDLTNVTQTEGTHPTPLHFTKNVDGSWSNR